MSNSSFPLGKMVYSNCIYTLLLLLVLLKGAVARKCSCSYWCWWNCGRLKCCCQPWWKIGCCRIVLFVVLAVGVAGRGGCWYCSWCWLLVESMVVMMVVGSGLLELVVRLVAYWARSDVGSRSGRRDQTRLGIARRSCRRSLSQTHCLEASVEEPVAKDVLEHILFIRVLLQDLLIQTVLKDSIASLMSNTTALQCFVAHAVMESCEYSKSATLVLLNFTLEVRSNTILSNFVLEVMLMTIVDDTVLEAMNTIGLEIARHDHSKHSFDNNDHVEIAACCRRQVVWK